MSEKLQYVATALFALAILHTFLASFFTRLAHRSDGASVRAKFFHLLGEVETVFVIWGALFVGMIALLEGPANGVAYVESLDFTEPLFVFVIMAVCATRSIRNLAIAGIRSVVRSLRRIFPKLPEPHAFFGVTLFLGPLLGSLITEPAAMTVVALILRDRFFTQTDSERFKYKTLGVLFVNISIGGVLTHFAAPPVVMVAKVWDWTTPYLFQHFGWKAAIAVLLNAGLATRLLRRELASFKSQLTTAGQPGRSPFWVTALHLTFLVLIVLSSHHATVFVGLFLLFLGVMSVTEPHQDRLQLRESLLVGAFLGGLVVLGRPQGWWLTPLLQSLGQIPLFTGAALLTAITDNAALTYLGSQVPHLSESMRYALVAGAVTGGGLTVIANAPNPAGYGILKDTFEKNTVNPLRLITAALVPTLIAAMAFLVL